MQVKVERNRGLNQLELKHCIFGNFTKTYNHVNTWLVPTLLALLLGLKGTQMNEGPEAQASSGSQEIFRFHSSLALLCLSLLNTLLWLPITLREKLAIQVLSGPWGLH